MTQDRIDVVLDDCWNRIGVWGSEGSSCPQLERFIHCRNCNHYAAAGRLMLERPMPDSYRQEWTARFTDRRQDEARDHNSALLFRLGDEWLALDNRFVNEITPMRTIHSLPHRKDSLVKGLVNIRGELKLCISIGAVLQLEKARESYTTDHEILERMILVEKDGQSYVFPVSEAWGIIRYADHELQAAPATVARSSHTYTSAVLCQDQRHIGILDHELLFYALARGLQ